MRRNCSIDTAISAPVLPQLTAACADPSLRAVMADHIEVSLPWRMIWLGLSCMVTTPSA